MAEVVVFPPGIRTGALKENQVSLPAYEIPPALRDSLELSTRQIRDGLPMSFKADREQLSERTVFAGEILKLWNKNAGLKHNWNKYFGVWRNKKIC